MPPKCRKELSREARAIILTLWKEGHTYATISKKTRVPLSTVWYTVKRASKHQTLASLP
jgi:DNA-directed RNA polymerase specialized sigma24 family protein